MAERDRVIAALGARTHGVVTLEALVKAGIPARSVARRVEAGTLHRLHRGVFCIGHVSLSREGLWLAAARAGGSGAALSYPAAAESWQLSRHPSNRIDILVPRTHRPIRGVHVHETRTLAPEDITVRNGVPVVRVPRLLVEAAVVASVGTLLNLMHEAQFRRRLNLGALERCMARNATRSGHARLARSIELHRAGSAGTMSSLEGIAVSLCHAAGFPAPEIGIVVMTGDGPLRVDLLWRDRHVCVEIDGSGHGRRRTQHEDARRDALMRPLGLSVLRIDGDDLIRVPIAVIARLREALGSGVPA